MTKKTQNNDNKQNQGTPSQIASPPNERPPTTEYVQKNSTALDQPRKKSG